ncbi:MAG: UDP-N-acetylmuramoyl-tripeptide--D-alanyl-D-alanine ligase [bacterium]|nr:UDP-N-acetylmuramoyl-tripeptide--D-alanyl-D-alanine ligase [bacterium]
MKISEILKVTDAEVLSTYIEDMEISLSTDTRTIIEGDFYLPLKGASFDGENYINEALAKGACGAFVTKDYVLPKEYSSRCILKVKDTLTAYMQMANYRRNKLNVGVVAVTGSSGKTTVKELTASVLSENFKTFRTPLNHNNEIGFCQTIFEMPDDTEVLVLEMGMRGLGEIELLSKYAEPDVTIIANVGTAHIGRLGSRENIAKAKCEIVKYQRGDTFIAHNDELIKNTVEFDGRQIYYSLSDVEIIEKSTNYSKFIYEGNEYELNVGGDYNIENSLSSINCGKSFGMSIEQIKRGLKKYKPIEKRWETVNAGEYKIINDSYNANPDSMRVFVDSIFELYPQYTLILGDMGELGENEVQYHKELGEYINNHKNLDKNTTVITIGNLAENIKNMINNCNSVYYNNIDEAVNYIKDNISHDSTLFLKASRSMKFERIIESLGN